VKRIAYAIEFTPDKWLGGTNYYRNLIKGISTFSNNELKPVVFTGYKTTIPFLNEIPEIEIVRTRILDRNHPLWFLRQGIKKVFSYDILFEHLLLSHNIDLLSHSGYLRKNSKIPTIGWIPDFQHIHLPEFFTEHEVDYRNKEFKKICDLCSRVIFSSNTAKGDADSFSPANHLKYRVLHFAVDMPDLTKIPERNSLKEKYSLPTKFFFVPNQFWAHKNHTVVIHALNILKTKGHDIYIVTTGNTKDERQPEYFKNLLSQIAKDELSDNFRILGIVPYSDLIGLMINSVAIINPSLFEGWSTTVEESKALGLRILLSDIPVHREQNPERGIFFNPHNPDILVQEMESIWESEERNWDETGWINKQENNLLQQEGFIINYQRIVMELLNQ